MLAGACAVYFVALGNSAIWDANEAFYVETPREMLEANDFLNPTFNYLPRFNKPVLSYWIVAGMYKVFGVSVTVQRFAIALGALLIIGCGFVLARIVEDRGPRTEDRESKTDDRTSNPEPRSSIFDPRSSGLWAAAGLAAAPRLVMFARRIFIDIWITAFLSLTLVFFALSERYPERRRQFLVLMYVSIGLGVLTKGPIAIALGVGLKNKTALYVPGHIGVGLALGLAGIRYRVRAREHVPTGRSVVFCSHHESHVYPPALFQALHSRLHVLFRSSLTKLPVLGSVMSRAVCARSG